MTSCVGAIFVCKIKIPPFAKGKLGGIFKNPPPPAIATRKRWRAGQPSFQTSRFAFNFGYADFYHWIRCGGLRIFKRIKIPPFAKGRLGGIFKNAVY
jgi:hypothetical protein